MGIHTPNYHYDQLNDNQNEIDEQSFLSFNSHNIDENILFGDCYSGIGLNDHKDQYINFINNNDDKNQNINKSNNDLSQDVAIMIDKNGELNYDNNTKEITNKGRKNNSKNKNSKEFNNSNNVIGKKRTNPSKSEKAHDKYDSDNIIRKINCHFLNFIIFLVNEIIKQQNIKIGNCCEYFRNINGEEKKKIRKYNVDKIKYYRISKILTFQNDSKFKEKNYNEKLFYKIKGEDNDILQKVLNMTYIDVFKKYFYSNKKNIIIVEGSKKLEIELSYPYDQFLLNIDAKEDDKYENKIKKVIEKYLLKNLFKVDQNF
jgi:hypothetical protein